MKNLIPQVPFKWNEISITIRGTELRRWEENWGSNLPQFNIHFDQTEEAEYNSQSLLAQDPTRNKSPRNQNTIIDLPNNNCGQWEMQWIPLFWIYWHSFVPFATPCNLIWISNRANRSQQYCSSHRNFNRIIFRLGNFSVQNNTGTAVDWTQEWGCRPPKDVYSQEPVLSSGEPWIKFAQFTTRSFLNSSTPEVNFET